MKKIQPRVKLPDKPSELITLALEDLCAVEKNPKYLVNMGDWHNPFKVNGEYKCEVCLAGAVIGNTLNGSIRKYLVPYNFVEEVDRKLGALNAFRQGGILGGLAEMDIPVPEKCPMYMRVGSYAISPKEFKKDMRKMVKILKKHDL